MQASFDYSDEADMVAKVQMALRVSPLVTALFANSPIREGRKTGALSFRTLVWREVDPLRCGIRPELFAPGFGYAGYAAWALDVPMIFVRREHAYLDPRGLTFRRFLGEGLDAERATLSDWEDHLTTLFPEGSKSQAGHRDARRRHGNRRDVPWPCRHSGRACSTTRAAREARRRKLVPLPAREELVALQESVAATPGPAGARRRPPRSGDSCREVVELASPGPAPARSGVVRMKGHFLDPLREILERGLTPDPDEALLRLDGELKRRCAAVAGALARGLAHHSLRGGVARTWRPQPRRASAETTPGTVLKHGEEGRSEHALRRHGIGGRNGRTDGYDEGQTAMPC